MSCIDRILAQRMVGALTTLALAGCVTMSGAPSRGLLRLEVTPAEAEVFVDDQYQGRIAGWRQGTLPVKPGQRRVALTAPGYITQRFDLEIARGEEVTLQVQLEPELEEPADPSQSQDKELEP
jgi:hypothetical protein